jgi:hypothetical protein
VLGAENFFRIANGWATLEQQLTSNVPVSPLSLLFGELKSSPFLCGKGALIGLKPEC